MSGSTRSRASLVAALLVTSLGLTLMLAALTAGAAAPARVLSRAARLSANPGAGCYLEHVIREGETLEQIAAHHNTTAAALALYNAIDPIAALVPGQTVCIPPVHPLATPTPLTDRGGFIDTAVLTNTVALTDSVALTGPAGFADSATVTSTETVTDTGTVTDAVVLTGTTVPTETAALTESASLTETGPLTDASRIQNPQSEIYQPSPVILWNEAALAAIRNGSARPTVVSRALFMLHAAIYDAWAAYDATATPYLLDPSLHRPPDAQTSEEQTLANKAAAIHQAAYQILVYLFTSYEANTHAFSSLLLSQGYMPVSAPPDPTTPEGIGYLAAQTVLSARAGDGANAAQNYTDTISATYPELYVPRNAADPAAPNAFGNPEFDPNRWAPLRVPTGAATDANGRPIVDNADPATYQDQTFLTPQWGAVQPFALTRGDQFRPPAPPQLGSTEPYTDGLGVVTTNDAAFITQTAELLNMSANLNDRDKVIAEYWMDGLRSETPPGHWNRLAHGIAARDLHTLDDDAKLFFALNGALFDAGISAWDAKRAYDYVRPITAIHTRYLSQTVEAWGGAGAGMVSMPGAEWMPYQDPTYITPAFPEYVSGHSTFSAAAAAVLTAFTGSDQFFDGQTVLYYEDLNEDGVPDLLGQYLAPVNSLKLDQGPSEVIQLRWPTFQAAAEQAGLSRRLGGIHFQDADLNGRAMGSQIGDQAFARAQAYWTGQP